MKSRSLLCMLAASFALGLLPKAALADTVSFTLTNPSQGVNQSGGILTFNATISAPTSNTGNEYLVGDSFNTGTGTINDADFYNTPLFLAPGQSFTGALFTLIEPANSADGVFLGFFSLVGGSTGGSLGTLGTQSFAITVTPEPSTWLLLGTGALGIAAMLRRRNGVLAPTPLA